MRPSSRALRNTLCPRGTAPRRELIVFSAANSKACSSGCPAAAPNPPPSAASATAATPASGLVTGRQLAERGPAACASEAPARAKKPSAPVSTTAAHRAISHANMPTVVADHSV